MTRSSSPFAKGFRDGIPILLGYLAVSFAFGIQAVQKVGSVALTPMQAGLLSITNLTSAGQKAGLTVIQQGGTYVEIALVQLVINLRYLLMSASLSQKLDPKTSTLHRLCVAYGVTDEIFAVSATVDGVLRPAYSYGLIAAGVIGWTSGTVIGASAGMLLPQMLINTMGVALYGMFIAVIVPPARKERGVTAAVLAAMALSALCAFAPALRKLSEGMRVILITLIVASVCSLIWPKEAEAA